MSVNPKIESFSAKTFSRAKKFPEFFAHDVFSVSPLNVSQETVLHAQSGIRCAHFL